MSDPKPAPVQPVGQPPAVGFLSTILGFLPRKHKTVTAILAGGILRMFQIYNPDLIEPEAAASLWTVIATWGGLGIRHAIDKAGESK